MLVIQRLHVRACPRLLDQTTGGPSGLKAAFSYTRCAPSISILNCPSKPDVDDLVWRHMRWRLRGQAGMQVDQVHVVQGKATDNIAISGNFGVCLPCFEVSCLLLRGRQRREVEMVGAPRGLCGQPLSFCLHQAVNGCQLPSTHVRQLRCLDRPLTCRRHNTPDPVRFLNVRRDPSKSIPLPGCSEVLTS